MRARREAPLVRRKDELQFFDGTETDLVCRVTRKEGSILTLDTEGLIGMPDFFQVRVVRSGAVLRLKTHWRVVDAVGAEILAVVGAPAAEEAA